MNARRILARASQAALFLGVLGLGSTASPLPDLATAAEAVVGAPLSPVSYAGVARRTARRTTAVVASSSSAASASAAASQQQAAAAQQQAAAAQQQAAQAQAEAAAAKQEAAAAQQQAAAAQQAAKLPVGTTVSALPSGCTTINLGGVDYFNCSGTYYRAAFQSNNIVYVVSQP